MLGQDLLDLEVQKKILQLFCGRAFRGFSAGPVCSSISIAIVPARRTREFPEGKPGLTAEQADKVRLGNFMLEFEADRPGLVYLVENPLNSWMWAQPAWISWKRVVWACWDFFVDYCVFGIFGRKLLVSERTVNSGAKDCDALATMPTEYFAGAILPLAKLDQAG